MANLPVESLLTKTAGAPRAHYNTALPAFVTVNGRPGDRVDPSEARTWLSLGHYIYDGATRQPLTVDKFGGEEIDAIFQLNTAPNIPCFNEAYGTGDIANFEAQMREIDQARLRMVNVPAIETSKKRRRAKKKAEARLAKREKEGDDSKHQQHGKDLDVPAQPCGQGNFCFLNTVDVILTGEGVGQTPFGARLRPQASLFRPSEQHPRLSVPGLPRGVAGGEGGTSTHRDTDPLPSVPFILSTTPIVAPPPPGMTFSPALLDRNFAAERDIEALLHSPPTAPLMPTTAAAWAGGPDTTEVCEQGRELEEQYGRGRVPRQIPVDGTGRRTSSVPGREVGWDSAEGREGP
ncbi:hypothetical protein LTS18_014279 [Coniosporium uncinatum]|uniref:Uncharacterized protein n=1 Tax=Coniosporium uncinatum TaxID=93489 RepID=A0ACC3D8J2_9PEZI|nr:hypothetical protein LTS18_014279 [Coniosporium uncinatum]